MKWCKRLMLWVLASVGMVCQLTCVAVFIKRFRTVVPTLSWDHLMIVFFVTGKWQLIVYFAIVA